MEIKNISDFRKAVRHGPYAWPGGYPVYFVMGDGEAVAFNIAKTECRRQMLEALRDHPNGYPEKEWLPVAIEVNWEDQELYCAHTGNLIECAYPSDKPEQPS